MNAYEVGAVGYADEANSGRLPCQRRPPSGMDCSGASPKLGYLGMLGNYDIEIGRRIQKKGCRVTLCLGL
jgi:hypothetical protein